MERKDISLYTPEELDFVDCLADEQEFTVGGYRSDKRIAVWVSDNTMLTKMKKMMAKDPNSYKLEEIAWTKNGTVAGYKFSMPRKLLRFGTESTFSEEEKARRRERLAQARALKSDE